MTSACYSGCPLLDTSNVCIAYHGRGVLELLWRSLWTRCLCQRSLLPLRTMHSAGLFPQIWSPLGSSLLVTNERAFLTVGILELWKKRSDQEVTLSKQKVVESLKETADTSYPCKKNTIKSPTEMSHQDLSRNQNLNQCYKKFIKNQYWQSTVYKEQKANMNQQKCNKSLRSSQELVEWWSQILD